MYQQQALPRPSPALAAKRELREHHHIRHQIALKEQEKESKDQVVASLELV
jgi:hypothetical protein